MLATTGCIAESTCEYHLQFLRKRPTYHSKMRACYIRVRHWMVQIVPSHTIR